MWRWGWLGKSFGPLNAGFNRLGRFAPDPAIPFLALEKPDWQRHALVGVERQILGYAPGLGLAQTQVLAGAERQALTYSGYGLIGQTQRLTASAAAILSYGYGSALLATEFLFPRPNWPGVIVVTLAWGIEDMTPQRSIEMGD